MHKICLIGLIVVLTAVAVNGQDVERVFLKSIDDSTVVLKFGRYRIELREGSDTLWIGSGGLYWDPAKVFDSALFDSIHDGLGRFGGGESSSFAHRTPEKSIFTFHPDSILTVVHPATYLEFVAPNISDSAGLHPNIYFNAGGWPTPGFVGDTQIYAHPYWMMQTPLDSSITDEEPTLFVSDDSTTWFRPYKVDTLGGGTTFVDVPLCPFPGGQGVSDPDLILGFDDSLRIYWRRQETDSSILYSKASYNGIDWSDSVLIFRDNQVIGGMSPAVVPCLDGLYRLWAVCTTGTDTVVALSTSQTPTGFFPQDTARPGDTTHCSLNGLPATRQPWHLTVCQVKGLYVMSLTTDSSLRFANYLLISVDGVNWSSASSHYIEGSHTGGEWDSGYVYTAELVPHEEVDRIYFDVFYSGYRNVSTPDADWHIGRTRIELLPSWTDTLFVTEGELEDSLDEYSLTSTISSTYETITNVGKIGDDTTNFKTAYGWGDHSAQGYVDTAELHDTADVLRAEITDTGDVYYQPLEPTLTDIADGIIDENLDNTINPWADNEIASSGDWNTAYGWGDHSGQNYLDNDDANVDTATWNLDNSAGLAAALDDETGTGVAVFGTSPYLVTPTCSTSITVTNDDWIGLGSGAGRIEFDSLTTDEVNILDANVGIGTATPDAIFHIKANIPGTVGSHPGGQIIIQNPADNVWSNAVITGYESDVSGNPDQQLWYLGSSSSSNSAITFLNRRNAPLSLGTNGITRMTIDDGGNGGNVGIGTSSPSEKLSVAGNISLTGSILGYFDTAAVVDTIQGVLTEGAYTTKAVVGDTADVLRAEMDDSSAAHAGDTATVLRGEMHTRSHTVTSTSDHTAGKNKTFYSDGSNDVQELDFGASGKVLTSSGASSAPTWETPSAAWDWQDSAGEPPFWVDSAKYSAATGGLKDAFVAGKLTVTGPIDRYNIKLELDTTNIYCPHADTILRLPIDTSEIGDANDTFQFMHPSPFYIPDVEGKFGYKYWIAGTPPFGLGENIHILVSNDEETWTEFVSGSDTLYNPVFVASDFTDGSNLSDPDIVWDEDGDLFLVFRVQRDINGMTIFYLYVAATSDGIDWTDTTMAIDGYYNKGSELSPDTGTLKLLSPGLIMRGAGDYLMYTGEDTTDAQNGPKLRTAWVAPRIDTVWDNDSDFDNTYLFGNPLATDTIRVSMTNYTMPAGNKIYHTDEIVYSSDLMVSLFNVDSASTNPRIYMAVSTDGEYFTTVSTPLLATTNNASAWDHNLLYRASGYWIYRDGEVILRMYYCAKSDAGDWFTGITDIHFGDVLHIREDIFWNPDLLTDTLRIFYVDSMKYPGGIEIQSLEVQTSEDGTYALKFFSFTAADPPVLHDYIDTLNVGASDQRASSETFENDEASLVDRGQFLYMLTPATDIDWINVTFKFFVRDWQ